MLMICYEEPGPPGPAKVEADPRYRSWTEEMTGRGVLQGGTRLRPGSEATTVRVRGEEAGMASLVRMLDMNVGGRSF